MSAATRVNLGGVVALLVLHGGWHGLGWWGAPSTVSLVAFGVPLAVVLAMHFLRRASARFWAGVLALATFSHGVMEAWAMPVARQPGLIEVALSVVVVVSASWAGLQARFGRGRKRPTV